MTALNSAAVYAFVNTGESFVPEKIKERAARIDKDIGLVLKELSKKTSARTVMKNEEGINVILHRSQLFFFCLLTLPVEEDPLDLYSCFFHVYLL